MPMPAALSSKAFVQIPLWTIVTLPRLSRRRDRVVRSDSSMDDCNGVSAGISSPVTGVQIPLWTIVTVIVPVILTSRTFVQIPLWTIVTTNSGLTGMLWT